MESFSTGASRFGTLIHPSTPTVVIQPSSGWKFINVREIWRYRDLLWLLADRDIRLRYKQTVMGVAWVFLQPILPALIFAVLFGRFVKLPSDGVPYGLFVFCGMISWNLFSGSLQRAGNSLVADARLISKVYFPRLIIPMASLCAVLFDFVMTLGVLAAMMILYWIGVSWRIFTLPLFIVQTLIAAAGISLWISALNVKYRDFMYAMPFLIQLWMYATPIVYATSVVPEKWRWLYSLNPAVGFIEGFRWSLLGTGTLSPLISVVSNATGLFLFLSGAVYFRSVEREFADSLGQ